MKILVVGSGGREHAIVWKLKQSPKCTEIFCAPGNAGIAQDAECVKIAATDIPALVDFAKEKQIDLTVIGMDDPLMLGVVDAFEEAGLRVFGPRKNAAILEGSKAFSKELMHKYGIPTADFWEFTESEAAKTFLKEHRDRFPWPHPRGHGEPLDRCVRAVLSDVHRGAPAAGERGYDGLYRFQDQRADRDG